MKKIIYFLGYTADKTRLIKFLKKTKKVKLFTLNNRVLTIKKAKDADLIISFGYRKIIDKKILQIVKRPILNLHMSYLPFNRGAHPNFWAFVDNTKKGISIHEIDHRIDKGKIIFRKEISFKNLKNKTFKNTYKLLFRETEKLFIKNFKNILSNNYKSFIVKNKGTFHKKKELPKELKNWNVNIDETLKVMKQKKIL